MTSAVLTVTARQIALAALRASGIIRPDEEPVAEDLATAIEAMNFLIKAWQAQGNHLWSQEEGVVFANVAQRKYLLGPGGDEACMDDDLIKTTLTAEAAALATTITVADTTDMLGAPDLLTVNPLSSTSLWAGTNATVTNPGGNTITVTNSGAAAGFADYTMENLTVGDTYLADYTYDKGTSAGCTFSVVDLTGPTTLVTETETASTSGVLEFTATQTSLSFRVENTSTTTSEDSTITLLELRNKADGDFVGIKQDDNTRHWTNIVRVVSSTSLDINAGMVSVAASGQTVFTFTELIDRPLRIYNPRTETIGSENEFPIHKWTRSEYMDQPTKDSQGTIVQLYYSPQLTNGALYVWQVASDCNQVARFTYDRPLDISTDQLDNPDFPSEWFNALKWTTAREIVPEYRVSDTRAARIEKNAALHLELALSFDEETGDTSIRPDYEGTSYAGVY